MKKLYFVICDKYRKFEICSKRKNKDGKLFEEKESIEIFKILDLNENI